ncbi:TRAP transporter large permease [Halocella sp. SP3-1]|uniref:TRAP transporter large permease n=1 Tax=Halocella sp. SP3-1 TaxID=2382161 RepID=UPI000F763CBC|nr:TRAP transporter large permease [Halocella sp. SP3-1]AZO96375.1 TRAP transporter large permease [Halocella sp. SP3-1]
MIITLIIAFFITLVFGFPIAYVIGFSTLVYTLVTGTLPDTLIPQRLFVGTDKFVLLAVPFFMLAGELMNASQATKKLVNLANAIVGHLRGGLAQVNIFVSMLFAGVTGAGTADTAAIGSLLIPAMVDEDYTPEYSAAVTAASSVIGPIIPPSVSAVIFGVSAQVSVGAILLAGAIPGLLLGLGQMAVVNYHARKYNFPKGEKSTLPEIGKAFKDALPPLLIPLVIIGGIVSGYFTPTEAAAIAVLVALVLGFVYKTIKLKDLSKLLLNTAITSGSVMIIVGLASSFGWVLTIERIPHLVTTYLTTISQNPYLILILINILLLFVGTFMETTASIIIMTPILLPVVQQMGIDPIHFGAIMIVNLGIGLATPPLGLCLFIASTISKASLEDITKAIIGFLLVSSAVLLLITYYEPISMYLPNLLLK